MTTHPRPCLAALAACLSLAAVPAAQAQTKFSYASPSPAKGPEALATEAYFGRVEKALGPQITFTRAYDGQVVNFRNALTSVRDGLVDGAYFVDVFALNDMKGSNTIADLGMTVSDPWVQAAASSETLLLGCAQCDAEWAKFKLKPLAFNGSSPFAMMCRSPINSLADLKGKSIRAVSVFQPFARSINAVPVATASGEVFEALQRGAVECAIGQIVWLRQFGLADVTKFVVDKPIGLYASNMVFGANADTWKRLTPVQRAAMVEQLPFLVAEATANNVRDAQAARREAEAKGVRFGNGGDEFRAYVDDYRKREFVRVVKDAAARGVDKPADLVERFRLNVAKWERIVAETGGDRAKYEEALRREIYAKLK
jgi:TRAP-type C4-dicarboxylate transport system substrate-binding protein